MRTPYDCEICVAEGALRASAEIGDDKRATKRSDAWGSMIEDFQRV